MPTLRQRIQTRKAIIKQNRKAKWETRKADAMATVPKAVSRIAVADNRTTRADDAITQARAKLDSRANALSAPVGPVRRTYRRLRASGSVRALGTAATKRSTAASALGKATRGKQRLDKKIAKADKKITKYN